jgi:hypothetical protein
VVGPEDLAYLQLKLRPHDLCCDDRYLTRFAPASDTSQATHSELLSHPVIVNAQPSATLLPTGSVQPETDNDSNLFDNSSHDTAGVNVDMLDCDSEDDSDALIGRSACVNS